METQLPPDISVIIPTYNGQKLLKTCLESVYQMNGVRFEVIVVDNGSVDNTKQFIAAYFPQVRGIFLAGNYGFAKAVNVGIENSRGKYIALLNNDTEVDPGWAAVLKNSLDEDSSVGFCASKMLNFHLRQIMDGAGDMYFRNGNAYRLGWGLRDSPAFNQSFRVFGACAGAAMYRRSMLDDIGWLDEDFFLYYEDVDLNFRAQLLGYQCKYVPGAVVYHIGSATTGSTINKITVFYSCRNAVFVLLKNCPLAYFKKNMKRIIGAQTRHLFGFLRASIRIFCYALGGYCSAFWNAPRFLRKRQAIQEKRKVSDDYIHDLLLHCEELMTVHDKR